MLRGGWWSPDCCTEYSSDLIVAIMVQGPNNKRAKQPRRPAAVSEEEHREKMRAEIREMERRLLELRRERKNLAAVAEQQSHMLEGVRLEEETKHYEGRPQWWGNQGGRVPSLRLLAEEVLAAKRENMELKVRFLRTQRALKERRRLLREIISTQGETADGTKVDSNSFADQGPQQLEEDARGPAMMPRSQSSRVLLQHLVSRVSSSSGKEVIAEQILRFKDHVGLLAEGRFLDAKRCSEELASAERNLLGWKERVAASRGRILEKEDEIRDNTRILQLLRSAYEGGLVRSGGPGHQLQPMSSVVDDAELYFPLPEQQLMHGFAVADAGVGALPPTSAEGNPLSLQIDTTSTAEDSVQLGHQMIEDSRLPVSQSKLPPAQGSPVRAGSGSGLPKSARASYGRKNHSIASEEDDAKLPALTAR